MSAKELRSKAAADLQAELIKLRREQFSLRMQSASGQTVKPSDFGKVKKMFLEELDRIRAGEPTKEEVEDVKKYLLGSLAFRLTTNDRIAGQLLSIERYNLGFDYLEKYRQAVQAVTPADVLAVAKKHINPQRLVLVAVGPLSEKGLPLEKK